MKGRKSFSNALFENETIDSTRSRHFFKEANQNVKNIISDILLTIDEEDKNTLNIAEILRKTKSKANEHKNTPKRVFSSKQTNKEVHSRKISPQNKVNFQTYLCSNQKDFFKKIADIVEEESYHSSKDSDSDDETNINHISDSFVDSRSCSKNKDSFINDDCMIVNNTPTISNSNNVNDNETNCVSAQNNVNIKSTFNNTNELFSNKCYNTNNNNTNNVNNNFSFFRFPSKKKETQPKSILKNSSFKNDVPKKKKSQRFSVMICNNKNNILNINYPLQQNVSLKNKSSLGVFTKQKQPNKDSKKIQGCNIRTYDLDTPNFKSSILKKRKGNLSPKRQFEISNDDNSDDTSGNTINNRNKRKKSYSNFNHLRRQSKVLNIEKQIRESFNIQQKKRQLRERVSQRVSVVLPQGIEKEFDNFISESNDDVYKCQTLCSELRINMLQGKRQQRRKSSDKSVKEFSLEQFQRLQENETSFELGVSPSGSKTCTSNLRAQNEEQQNQLSAFGSHSVSAMLLNKEENEHEHKLIQHKVTKPIEIEEELSEEKKLEKMRQKETNYRALFKKNNPIYDSLSDQEKEDEQLETDHFYIQPDSPLRKILDSSIALFSVLFVFIIPIEVAYIHIWKQSLFYFTLLYSIGEVIFLIDFILSFFMAYFDKHDNLIINKQQIRINYITSWLCIDLITAVPTNTIINLCVVLQYNGYYNLNSNIFTMSQCRFVHCIKLIKIAKIIKICFNNYCIQSIVNNVLYSKIGKSLLLYVTIIVFITILHILTCLFVFFGYSYYPNWILKQHFHPTSYSDIYVAGLYFIILTIVGVGYGDIIGTNTLEMMYLVFLLIIGVLLYSWLVSSLSKIKDSDTVIAISERAEEIKNQFNILESIRQSYSNITYDCYKRIQRYLKYNFKKELFSPKTIFDNLPVHLQRDLIFNMYKSEVENFIFFKYFENEDFIMKVLMCFQQNICIKNERIVNKGDFMDEMLFVRSGKLAIEFPLPSEITTQVFENRDKTLTHYLNEYKSHGFLNKVDTLAELRNAYSDKTTFQYVKLLEIHKNEHYGDIVMLLNQRSPLGVRVCTRKAELFYLKKTDAIEISVSFPSIWKKLITNSLFNMKQISFLIKKTLNYYYMHNKKILQRLISQNESYFDHMKTMNFSANLNLPDIDESNANLKINESNIQQNGVINIIKVEDNDDNEKKETLYTKSNGTKTNLISESNCSVLRNNSDEGFLIQEEQKGNLKLNSQRSNNNNVNNANTNINNNHNYLSLTNVNNINSTSIGNTHLKSKFFLPNQMSSSMLLHPTISLNPDNNSLISQSPQIKQSLLSQNNNNHNTNLNISNINNVSSINNGTNDFILSSRKNSMHSKGSSPHFTLRHRESLTKQNLQSQTPMLISNILSTNLNQPLSAIFTNANNLLNSELYSQRSNEYSALSSSFSTTNQKQKEIPSFILNLNSSYSNVHPILIVNNELNHGESLVTHTISKQDKPLLSISSSSDDDDYIPQHKPRQSKLLSDTKLKTIANYTESMKPHNVFTQNILNEFNNNQSTPQKENHQQAILTKSTSTRNLKNKKQFLFSGGNNNTQLTQTTVIPSKEEKKKKQKNFLSQRHLTQLDTFLNKVNCTPVLSKRKLPNKKGTLNLQQIKLERIQSNIEQNQLNLKNPQMFYSEAFKEMINSKEKKKSFKEQTIV